MESFETILAAGGHTNSLGRSNEVFAVVKNNPDKINELFDCVYAQDAWVRMRAIDTFEKLVCKDPLLARPFTKQLTASLTKTSQASIQWHLAQLFAEIELTQTQRTKAVRWLRDIISTTDVDWIVSVNAMKSLLHFRDTGAISSAELEPLFRLQAKHKSNAVRKKAAFFLDNL